MQKTEKAAFDAARAILAPRGFEVVFKASKRHPCIVARAPDGWLRTCTISCSPRDDANCQANYASQWARRVLKERVEAAA